MILNCFSSLLRLRYYGNIGFKINMNKFKKLPYI